MANYSSLTRIFRDSQTSVVALFGDTDGDEHLSQLISFLKQFTVGGTYPHNGKKYAEDMSCLAAQLVAHFKTKPGRFYISPFDSYSDRCYDVYLSDDNKGLYVCTYNIFDGIKQIYVTDKEYTEIAEFVYDSTTSEMSWRRIGIQRDDDEWIGGIDLNDNNRYKLFRCDRIFGGKSKIIKTKV